MPKIKRSFTNKHNLPQILADAVMNDKYDSGKSDISVTSLIDSPRVVMLNKRYQAEIETDVTDLFASAMGTAFHHFMELSDETCRRKIKILDAVHVMKNILYEINQSNDFKDRDKVIELATKLEQFYDEQYPEFAEDIIVEVRNYIEINGWVLSGQFDRLKVLERDDDGNITKAKLSDYKQVTTFAYKNPSDIEKWTRQQNIYRYMLMKLYGIEVVELEILMVFRDWSKSQSKIKGAAYPRTWGDSVILPLIPYEEIEAYLEQRIKLHQTASQLSEEEFEAKVKCSKKDVWLRDESYAVKKEGGSRAVTGGVFAALKDAENFISQNQSAVKEKLVIEHRAGIPVRCVEYCAVSKWCKQYQAVAHKYENK
jgi:hypothetical protein